ncbi:hypothetical protein DICPUDRAFT_78660 [Dictyostelium purpureum]|uniref:phosphoinositide 5-phosphatase n=1 Tax=Dictyostelium purpureum TaxID=5786 RepID=F0ZK63_DICPU|nr:uncharacterized protein DICPUDRAFT_78660 [Dictyostelium purpureum]EGC35666.1 hypothetical protein DICPUDRAFT_78660 [Dictyostelium purpureum]|eukprot:XP_003287799.1 hypothetical protein DICPUDRAFT_78660 [Dictyostelium purpureum]
MADNTFRIYINDRHFIVKRDSLNSKALVINRHDPSKIDIIASNQIDPNLRSDRTVYCVLGIFRIYNECFLVVVTESDIAANFQFKGQQNVIRKIRCTDFISFVTGRGHSALEYQQQQQEYESKHPYVQVMNLLNSGHFYWTPPNSSFDITRTYQRQVLDPKEGLPVWERVDKRFYWNKYLQKDFIAYRLYDWCFPIIQGYVVSDNLGHIQSKNVQYTLISRRSRFRAGTRFVTRGIDDDGNVANFVETEQILSVDNFGVLAFLQIRGSVPVFWNQSSPQLSDLKIKMSNLSKIGKISKKKIVIARNTQATTPAFQLHMKEQTSKYGNIVIVNLLSKLKSGECDLINAYEEQIRILRSSQIFYNHFDLHEQTKGNRMDSLDSLVNYIDNQVFQQLKVVGYFFQNANGQVQSKQNGIIRTNCKDCLDRTNIVQSRISWILFENHLRLVGLFSNRDSVSGYTRMSQLLKTMWADNGDALSIQYAGSGSLKSTLTREGDYGIMGMLADGKKTMTRFYINNFKDPGRQDVLDLLLGLHKSMAISHGGHDDNIRKEVQDRVNEYSQKEFKNVFVGTYNVGGVPSHTFNLTDWLKSSYPAPDFYVLGLQEVVELTAGQILATDSSIGRQWEDAIERALARTNPSVKYIKLQSSQLVGLLLCIYVKEDSIYCFREVQIQNIKVGLQGLAGNKGGIGVRLLFADTSFTFVTAHFAAGHSNVDDRVNDFREIDSQLAFGRQGQYRVSDSDYSFWLGDFNFRIDLPDEEIKRCINDGNFPKLYDHDQLKRCMETGRVFGGFREEVISFAPTYKYDLNTNRYDTSQKQRAPAYTDRILWANKVHHDLRQLYYTRHEIFSSDHRPVSSYFQVEVTKIDKEKERLLRQQLYEQKSSQFISINKDGANTLTKEFDSLSISSRSQALTNSTYNNNNGVAVNHSQPVKVLPTNTIVTPKPIVPVNSNANQSNIQYQITTTQQENIKTRSGSGSNSILATTTSTQRKLSSGRPLPMVPTPNQQQTPQQLLVQIPTDFTNNNNINNNNNVNNAPVSLTKLTGSGGKRSPSSSFLNNSNNNNNNNNNSSSGSSNSLVPVSGDGNHSPFFDDQFDPRKGRLSPIPSSFNDSGSAYSNNNTLALPPSTSTPPPMELLVPTSQPTQHNNMYNSNNSNSNTGSGKIQPIHSSSINPNSLYGQQQLQSQSQNLDQLLIDSWGAKNSGNSNNNYYRSEPPPLQPIPSSVYPPQQSTYAISQQPPNFMLQQPLQPVMSPNQNMYLQQQQQYSSPYQTNIYSQPPPLQAPGYSYQTNIYQQQPPPLPSFINQAPQQNNHLGSILD